MRLEDLKWLPSWEWPEEAALAIAEALEGNDPVDQGAAVELAGALYTDDRVARALVEIVGSSADPDLRARAAIALGPALEEHDLDLGLPDDPAIAKATFELACVALEAAYRDERNPPIVRRRALEGAVRAPRPWQAEAIRTALADPEWRATGVFCAAHVQGFEEEAIEALDDPDPDVRLEALRAVRDLGAVGEIGRLAQIALSDDAPREHRLAAIDGLSVLVSGEGVAALDRLVDSADEELAEAAREALDGIVDVFDEYE